MLNDFNEHQARRKGHSPLTWTKILFNIVLSVIAFAAVMYFVFTAAG